MNDAEQASNVVFVSLDGLVVSVINSHYQEVALLSVSSVPAVWEVEVNNRWKILNVELQTWLEDQWKNKQGQTNLQEQFEVGYLSLINNGESIGWIPSPNSREYYVCFMGHIELKFPKCHLLAS